MTDWPALLTAVPVGGYRLRLTDSDGSVGEVDFADGIGDADVFAFLRDPDRFKTAQVAHNGMALVWIDDDGNEIDFCADAQRMKAEANAVAHLGVK